jgi:hypothetical protein
MRTSAKGRTVSAGGQRETRLESPQDEAVGWGRAAQEAAEAASAALELEQREPPVQPLEREPRPFLDRALGYSNYRSALVVLGGVLGAIIGGLAGGDTSSGYGPPEYPVLGFVAGCLTVALVLVIVRLKSSSPETEASRRQRRPTGSLSAETVRPAAALGSMVSASCQQLPSNRGESSPSEAGRTRGKTGINRRSSIRVHSPGRLEKLGVTVRAQYRPP